MPKTPPLLALLSTIAALALLLAGGPAIIDEARAQALPGGSSPTGANISATRHNLSTFAPARSVTSGVATTEPVIAPAPGEANDLCVYCHTPHAASTEPGAPLWNRSMSVATYTPYASTSLQASDLDVQTALATPSKLCLSCHDGTIAIGQVSNAPGSGGLGGTVTLQNTGTGGVMPGGRGQAASAGSPPTHGFTRNLGTDLRNDHPIAFTYDSTLAAADGELRTPSLAGTPKIGNRVSGQPKPDFPLVNDTVQCTTCHEPHRNTQKFLNKNRLQTAAPQGTQLSYTNWSFADASDQLCLACHTRLGRAWAVSAHANSTVAGETYTAGGAAMRDFPTDTPVWQAGCLNCHDTHTVSGSRRLLREGVNASLVAVNAFGYSATMRAGVAAGDDLAGTSALENTCYQCHGNSPVITPTTLSGGNTVPSNSEGVPNLEQEFARAVRMPIGTADQGGGGNTSEVHDITDADGSESQTQLGFFSPQNRHVECTDCHNPHRVVKGDTFLGGNLTAATAEGPAGDVTRRTHVPARGTTGNQGNIASGALRGAWGVEPSYTASGQGTVTTSSIWPELPTFTEKRGDPGAVSSLPVGTVGTNSATYLTREYQLCFKCHSNYANGALATDFPSLGHPGGTSNNTNQVSRYTNVAAEFAARATDPPSTGLDQGEATNVSNICQGGVDCVPSGSYPQDTNSGGGSINHRSWHPVVFPTGRNGAERGNAGFANIRPPFSDTGKIGLQTMQCSDCHGMSTSWTDGSGPNLTQVQGPHGSADSFLLKGSWTSNTALASIAGSVCENCHVIDGNTNSGLNGNHIPDGNMAGARCMRCHIAVPHGWKNKAFLVNKRCVGPEGGQAGTCNNIQNFLADFNAPPYYVTARNGFLQWRRSRDNGYTVEDSTCNNQAGGAGNMKDCAKGEEL